MTTPRTHRLPAPLTITAHVSGMEAERAAVINDLENYLAMLTSSATPPIVSSIVVVLAFDRLEYLHELDSEQDLSGLDRRQDTRRAPDEQATHRRRNSDQRDRPGRPHST